MPGFVGVPTIVWPACFTCFFFLSLYVVAAANASPFGKPATFAIAGMTGRCMPVASVPFVKFHSNGTYAIVVMLVGRPEKIAVSALAGFTSTRYFIVSLYAPTFFFAVTVKSPALVVLP